MQFLFDGDGPRTLVLAHGAGGAMDTPFLNTIAKAVAEQGFRVARFEFPYMAARREGKRKAIDRQPVLLDTWRHAIDELGGGESLFIGGKSLGGRMASMVADELQVRGLVCLGYPFHPPDKPQQLRTAHLETLRTPALFVQGERDPFGTRAEVKSYALSRSIRIVWLRDGDHSFKPRVSSGVTERENLTEAAASVSTFLRQYSVI